MTERELYDQKGIAVEPYAGGFILADYSDGGVGWARFRGVSPEWRKQPVVSDPFSSKEAAIEAAVAK